MNDDDAIALVVVISVSLVFSRNKKCRVGEVFGVDVDTQTRGVCVKKKMKKASKRGVAKFIHHLYRCVCAYIYNNKSLSSLSLLSSR